ncbi:septation protein SepH [Arthrobacter agilis]|uniref:septation protein SepH n=1 Tax=Arthrobacter agilis TaxID=37921 RepID=UPI0023671F28|nr:septation protein SepH [Arthrobacter agilis]WDF34601.1 septation protein SepH [Arthrobacter agilis]
MGVHEDGEHLLLGGEQDTSYRLPIDDALRAASARRGPGPAAESASEPAAKAAREVPPIPADRPKPAKAAVHLTPRDIQARIRAGATAEQVAAESDQDLAHVRRYEGPVRAERDYLAYLAQRVEVATPLPSHDGYRSAFGDDPATLGDMVAYRVRSYGIDPASLEWDSWRLQDGSWHVEASFDLPEDFAVDLGEQPPARWTYNPTRKTVANGNRWAQVLSELEPLDGPLPSRRLSAVADRVFDFEAESDAQQDSGTVGTGDSGPAAEDDHDGLLEVLRSRRGQRLGADEDGDDALAELLTRGAIPAAHPRGDADDAENREQGAAIPGLSLAPRNLAEEPADATGDQQSLEDRNDGSADRAGQDRSEDSSADQPAASTHHDDGTPRLHDVSTETREISIFAQPSRKRQPPAAPTRAAGSGPGKRDAGRPSADAGQQDGDAAPDRKAKPKRSSVPSWDDIVFGRKGD